MLRWDCTPRGWRPLIINLGQWRAHWCRRLERQIEATGDADLVALLEEIAGYPIPVDEPDPVPPPEARELLGPVRFRAPGGGELSFFGMFATFDTPFEVTISELAMELLFPADRATAEALEDRDRTQEARGESSSGRVGRLIVGAGALLLIVSLFLPWADKGGVSAAAGTCGRWPTSSSSSPALCAIAAAITGGRVGLFRPDLTLIGATDLLGLVAFVLIGWLLVFDFPAGADREIGAFLALVAAITIAGGAGDYRPLRGASWFPKVP